MAFSDDTTPFQRMKILILNVGSSTIKLAVFDGATEVFRGLVDHVGTRGKTYETALAESLELAKQANAFQDFEELDGVVHRVVHGGNQKKACIISSKVLHEVQRIAALAPLHDIPELKVIKACQRIFSCPHIAVFDTAFHQSMPERAWRYALPIKWTKLYGVRRFGFHGLSHSFLARRVPLVLNKKVSRLITCHIGNGVSVAAIKNGVSIDTSMGWTPLEGCMMGTRCGDIDPAIPMLLMKKTNLSEKQMNTALNTQSGLRGVCDQSDMRRILVRKDPNAKLAVDMFCYRIQKYIGAYAAVLGGVDVIAFTGGIGANAAEVRKRILLNLKFLGVHLDVKKNRMDAFIISSKKSKVNVVALETNEERVMLEEAIPLIKSGR